MTVLEFLKDMADFAAMNAAYARRMGNARPTRTTIACLDLPKPGALLTMRSSTSSDSNHTDRPCAVPARETTHSTVP